MIYRDELKRLFQLLHKHQDLLIQSYLDLDAALDETDTDVHIIDALLKSRLLWQPSSDEPVRLSRELSSLFERTLRDSRRLTVDADIGSFWRNLRSLVVSYQRIKRENDTDGVDHYLGQIERLVDDLRCSLLDNSGQLWQKINREFGYVSSLELKIQENESALEQAKRLNDRLELISVKELEEVAGPDPRLRRYLLRWLLDAVEECRRETVDAIHKLNKLLFTFREQQRLGNLIEVFYQKYQAHPGYVPVNYAESGDIPSVLNQVAPMPLGGHADITDPRQEIFLTDLIEGLRSETVQAEQVAVPENIVVQAEQSETELTLSPLRQAVEDFFNQVVDADTSVSALENLPEISIEDDAELWLYAVIARYNAMETAEQALFDLTYQEVIDPVFSGRYIVHDVQVGLRDTLSEL